MRRGRRDAVTLALTTLSAVRRAQAEVKRAKARARGVSRLVSSEEYRNLLMGLETLDVLLERVALRLETILASGLVTRDLVSTPKTVIERAAELASSVSPAISNSLAELTDMMELLASMAPQAPGALYTGEPAAAAAEAEEVLKEAREEAKKRLELQGLS